METNDPGCKQPLSWMEAKIVEIEKKLVRIESEQSKQLTNAKFEEADRQQSLTSFRYLGFGLGLGLLSIGITINAPADIQSLAPRYIWCGVLILLLALFLPWVRRCALRLRKLIARDANQKPQ
jgi:hypothetical protein